MENNVKLGVLKMTSDGRWQEESDISFGSAANLRWVVHYEVVLFDEYAKNNLEKSRWKQFRARHRSVFNSTHNPGGALGELFGFTVCSPAFKQTPTEDYSPTDLSRAYIQKEFNETDARKYLDERLSSVEPDDIRIIAKELRQFLETDELDYTIDNQ